MPGKLPCPIGCRCPKHPEGNLSPEEKAQRARERARERYLAKRDEIIAYNSERNKRPDVKARRRQQALGWSRTYREKNRGALNAKARAVYDPVAESHKSRKWKFGLSPEETRRLFDAQGGRCYLGGEPLDLDAPRGCYVDHAHWCCPGNNSCGECVRGLTCNNCNVGAGGFGDDPARMRRAADAMEAADAAVRARLTDKPVQAELFDINRAPRRQKDSALWLFPRRQAMTSPDGILAVPWPRSGPRRT
jgi:Recombination endonuclease VII